MTTTAPHGPTPRVRPAAAPRRWSDLLGVALLSAGLATGGTYAAVQLGTDPTTTTTVVQTEGAQAQPASYSPEQDWAAVAAVVTPSTVSIEVAGAAGEGSGSGVVWDDQGHVVTNAHVVAGAGQVRVTLADGRAYAADVKGSDPSSDLAVVQLQDPPAGLTPITVASESGIAVGDPVMAVGNPLGLSGTVTTGIVSALDRPVTTQAIGAGPGDPAAPGAPVVTNAIQTSAAINPGNSGGALVDASGSLVGINSSIASLSAGLGGQAGSIGIGFAIPAGKVQLIVDQLISTGTATHAFLGVALGDGQAEVDGALLTGAQVQQVEPDSPAATAGLQEGDLIVSIDGSRVAGATALVGQVRDRGAGDGATLTLVRGGAEQDVVVTLATRPDEG